MLDIIKLFDINNVFLNGTVPPPKTVGVSIRITTCILLDKSATNLTNELQENCVDGRHDIDFKGFLFFLTFSEYIFLGMLLASCFMSKHSYFNAVPNELASSWFLHMF